MAKVVGLVGSASGKVGNVVYAVVNGIQVARVYQPVVANPKSTLQLMQRAKGNLAGRISSFVPPAAIMGLGRNARQRRGEFLKVLLKAATVTLNSDVYVAKLDSDDLVFSKGSTPLSVSFSSIVAGAALIGVDLRGVANTAMSSEIYETMITRVVVLVYERNTNNLVACLTKIANKPAQGDVAETVFNYDGASGYDVVAYAIPMSTADGSAVSISTSLAGLSDNDIVANLTANGNAVVFDYGRSVLLGQASYTPTN